MRDHLRKEGWAPQDRPSRKTALLTLSRPDYPSSPRTPSIFVSLERPHHRTQRSTARSSHSRPTPRRHGRTCIVPPRRHRLVMMMMPQPATLSMVLRQSRQIRLNRRRRIRGSVRGGARHTPPRLQIKQQRLHIRNELARIRPDPRSGGQARSRSQRRARRSRLRNARHVISPPVANRLEYLRSYAPDQTDHHNSPAHHRAYFFLQPPGHHQPRAIQRPTDLHRPALPAQRQLPPGGTPAPPSLAPPPPP